MKMLLPCAAMFFWLMIENPSMFDMAFPDTSKAVRIVVPVLGAVLVLAMATRFELPKKETGQQEAREEAQVPLAGRQAEG